MHLRQHVVDIGESFFYAVLGYFLRDCESVLDVGCGDNSPLRNVRLPLYKEGIDAFRQAITKSRRAKIHNAYTIGDIKKLSGLYKHKSFDAAIAMDVIEHLTRKEGEKLLRDMEAVANRRVILLTPNGFYHQHDIDENPYQVHHSGWKTHDFEKAGYRVYGLRGLRWLRDDHASIRFRPWILWGALTMISELIFYFFPTVSFDLLAVKNLDT